MSLLEVRAGVGGAFWMNQDTLVWRGLLNMNITDLASVTEKRDAAYEIKFAVPIATAEAALAWARTNLSPDPHAEFSSDGDGYHVNSLYFDTSALDVYRRNGSYGKSKYRVRRYGNESCLYLERKLKSRGLVSKRRTRIPDEELLRLIIDPEADWAGYWFRRRLLARQLQPRCQIRYERVARVGMTTEGPIRFTVDRNVAAFLSAEFGVHETGAWRPLLPGQSILELKFRQEMPAPFKALTEALSLTPQPVSKYRLSIQAFGLDSQGQDGQAVQHNGHASPNALMNAAELVQTRMTEAPQRL